MLLSTYLSALRKCERRRGYWMHRCDSGLATCKKEEIDDAKYVKKLSRLADKLEKKIVKIMEQAVDHGYQTGWSARNLMVTARSTDFFMRYQTETVDSTLWNKFKKEVLGE